MLYRRYRCRVCGFVSTKAWRTPIHSIGNRVPCVGELERVQLTTEDLNQAEFLQRAARRQWNILNCRRYYDKRRKKPRNETRPKPNDLDQI